MNHSTKLLTKLSRMIRQRQQRHTVRKRQQYACHFQPLEPRQLLSAAEAIVFASSAPVRMVDAGTNQVQEEIHVINSAWFEDMAPQIMANADAGVESLNWRGTTITTISDQWIVQLNSRGVNEVSSVGQTYDLLSLADYNGQVIRGLGMEGLVLIQTEHEVEQAAFMQGLLDSGYVKYVQPNAVLENQATTPNDASFLNTWGLNNTGQFNGSVADADIDAPEAWDMSTGSSDVVVGIIDTGVKWDHVDLVNNMWTNPGEIAGNGIDDDGNGFIDDIHGYDFVNNDGNPMDDHGHGTHVAGTVSADGNNGIGVAGVSWNSQIMALKFMASSGSGSTSDAVRAINYATMMKTQYGVNILVTCNSWGGGGYSSSLYNAIVANRDAGMLFMAAAGNDATNNDSGPHYPSSYDVNNIIAVASTDWADHLSSFSNYGATSVDIAAPGSNIYSTTFNGAYGYMSGTSMATPQVAGLAALAWSYSPQSTWQEIKTAILTGGDTLAVLNNKVATGKRINAYNTLNLLTPAEPESNIIVRDSNNSLINDGQNAAISFGSVVQNDAAVTKSFTITNSGTADLVLSNWSLPSGFSLSQAASGTIAAGASSTFIVAMSTSTVGAKSGAISFTTNDPDIATFNFNLSGTVTAQTPAEVAVSYNNTNITDGSNTPVSMGNALVGATVQKTFTVTNSGTDALTISGLTISGDFSLVSGLPGVIARNTSATFVIAMDTSSAAAKNGTVTFNSNDSDESPFNFLVSGNVAEQPQPAEVTVSYSGGSITDGQATAIDFGDLDYGDTAPEITFTVTNTGDDKLTTSNLTANGGFIIVEGLSANILGGESDTFTIRMLTNSAGNKSGTVSFNTNDSDEAVFNFTVEGTIAAPVDGIDLSVDWAENPADYFIPGQKSKVLVDVTNNGTISLSDEITVYIYANTSNTLDGDEILLGQISKTMTLKPDQSKTNRVVIELDSEVPSDDYYIFAVVDPDDNIAESNEDNNVAVTSVTTEIAWKFGDLGDGKKTLLKLEDSDGSLVTFSINGKGVGEVIENFDGSWSLVITGTNNSSSVAINAKGGDGRVGLKDIFIGNLLDDSDYTVINQFAGKTVDLIGGGDFIITGTIQKLILGNVTDSHMDFFGSLGKGTDITLETLTDVTINADTGFNNFTLVEWVDSDATEDELNAYWVNKLSVKGSKKDNIVGDFATNLNLSGIGAGKDTLGALSVKGAVDGRTWNIVGNVNAMKIDSLDGTDMTIDGIASKLNFGHMLDGSITAQAIDKLATGGAKSIASNADFTADLTLTGTTKAKYTLNALSIKGDALDANWDVAGMVGTITVKGNADGLDISVVDEDDLHLNAGIDKLIFNTVDTADVTVEGVIGYLKANSWTSGTVTAETITNSKVNGVSLNVANALKAMNDKSAILRVVNI